MQIGAFELNEPLPELREPHVFAMVRPWVDVGSVGTLTLNRLERFMGSKELGRLSRPGTFFDFTRYRPNMRLVDGKREVKIPNSIIRYAQTENGHDFLFFHLLFYPLLFYPLLFFLLLLLRLILCIQDHK